MKVLVTGGAGLLGSELCVSAPRRHRVIAAVRKRSAPEGVASRRVDLGETGEVDSLFAEVGPDLVIHTAYSTADLQRDVVGATHNVARACSENDVRLVHLSTDAVFSGLEPPYAPLAPPDPVHPYGRAKAEAEHDVTALVPDAAVVRTSLICSFSPPYGANGWVVDSLRAGKPVALFANEIRCPIMVDDLARQIWQLVDAPRRDAAGFWHLVGPEALSRVEIGRVLCDVLGLDAGLIAEAVSSPDERPTNLTLVASESALLTSRPHRIATVGRHGKANR